MPGFFVCLRVGGPASPLVPRVGWSPPPLTTATSAISDRV